MIALCLLTGCGGTEEADPRIAYQTMEGCTMEAAVRCTQADAVWEAVLRCSSEPEKSTVEVLAPETIASVRAVLDEKSGVLEYEDLCLDAGPLGTEQISPAACLPRLMQALREGWLLEENRENWGEIPCVRLTLDQTGSGGGKILSTVWLRQEDGTPIRGEISVDGEIILTAEFTEFAFCDMISSQTEASSFTQKVTEHGRTDSAADMGGDRPGRSGT